ncbi:unnamed protein product, partial [Symbiodinium microadriaticum]
MWCMRIAAEDPWVQWTELCKWICRWLQGAYQMKQADLADRCGWQVLLAHIGLLLVMHLLSEICKCMLQAINLMMPAESFLLQHLLYSWLQALVVTRPLCEPDCWIWLTLGAMLMIQDKPGKAAEDEPDEVAAETTTVPLHRGVPAHLYISPPPWLEEDRADAVCFRAIDFKCRQLGWTSTSRYHSQVQAKYDKIQLDHEARHGGDRICALRVAMQAYLQQHDSATLEQINAQLLLQVSRLFPRRSTAPVQRAWNNPQVRGSVTAMWQARARLRNIWSTNLTRLRYSMEAFKRHRAFMQAYRLLKQNGRQARRALLTNELAAAAEAAQRNDSGQLHRIIRRLAPKSKRVQVRIHGPNGEMLRDAAEHEAIVEYFEDLFQSQQESMNIERGTDAAPQVTEKDVYDSLCLTKYGKAVPPQAAPSSAIKCCADILAQAITPTVNACLQGAATPPRWANCHLALIPKPHKVAKRPANLRPLGLQDCNAKAYARILKHLLLQDVATALASMPVFAYIPSRGTDDAIARVSDHCRRVRLIHQQQVSNVHTYRAHKPKLGAYGGLQLAIDLTTAFDTVPRDELGRALSWAGVRQGCTLAPLLYVIFSAYLISKLQARLPADWVRNHLTLYADDSHASFEISSTDDIIRSMHIIKCLFDVYREHGMCVNPLKSGVVLGVRGLKATELLNRHLQGKGDQQCLVIGLGKDELRIPVKTSMTYLGICVSYGNFEQETLSARLKVAQATRCRLSKVLSAHRSALQYAAGPDAPGSTEAPVRKMFPHLNPVVGSEEAEAAAPEDAAMPLAPTLGRRQREEQETELPDKFQRPAGKGQSAQTGKNPEATAPSQSSQSKEAGPSGRPNQPQTGRARQHQQHQQWTKKEWEDWHRQGYSKEKTNQELQKELEVLKEDVRLLARIAMRHEDELSQKRTETDFLLTMEVGSSESGNTEGILEQLYKMAVEWKEKQEKGEVKNSLRLTLFIGLLMYLELKVQEATSSADSLENLAKLGYLKQVDGNPAWNYLQWNHDKGELEQMDKAPLPDQELRSLLCSLKTSIGAPGALLRFHSSRKLVENHKTAVTFFLGIGLRDPLSLVCYRAILQLCFSASTQLIKMRIRPTKMERQPLVKVLQDAAEFLHFLLEHAKPAAYEGHCYQPIALEIHQDGLQAPRLLYLMIKRYTRHLTGPRKITTFMDYQ